MQRIKTDDLVEITTGKDKGKQGRVLRVLHAKDKVIVEGFNMMTKHMRPQTSSINPNGGRIELEAPLHVSNVMPVCPGCDEAVKVGYVLEDPEDQRSKTRYCKSCDEKF